MPDLDIAARYAAALYEASAAENAADRVAEDLLLLRDLWEREPDLGLFMTHPLIPVAQKESVLQQTLGEVVHPLTLRTLVLMAGNGRGRFVPYLASLFFRAAEERGKLVYVRLRTARPLEPAQLETIKARLARVLGQEVALEPEEAPELLAGVELEVRGRKLLFSARGRLALLAQKLKGEKG